MTHQQTGKYKHCSRNARKLKESIGDCYFVYSAFSQENIHIFWKKFIENFALFIKKKNNNSILKNVPWIISLLSNFLINSSPSWWQFLWVWCLDVQLKCLQFNYTATEKFSNYLEESYEATNKWLIKFEHFNKFKKGLVLSFHCDIAWASVNAICGTQFHIIIIINFVGIKH